jgi:hypothetical protein
MILCFIFLIRPNDPKYHRESPKSRQSLPRTGFSSL